MRFDGGAVTSGDQTLLSHPHNTASYAGYQMESLFAGLGLLTGLVQLKHAVELYYRQIPVDYRKFVLKKEEHFIV